MNAPTRTVSRETIETARSYGRGAEDSTGFALLSSLSREPRIPPAFRALYTEARDAMRRCAVLLAGAVEARDAAMLATIDESAPAASNDDEPVPSTERSP